MNIIQGKYRIKGIGKPESRQDVIQLATYGPLMTQEQDNVAALAEGADVSVKRSLKKHIVSLEEKSTN